MSSTICAQDVELPFIAEQEIEWYRPLGFHQGLLNQTMELGFVVDEKITAAVNRFVEKDNNGLNPYDPTQIDVHVVFTSPSGKIWKQNAFYMEAFRKNYRADEYLPMKTNHHWRVRFAPQEVGKWTAVFNVRSRVKVMRKSSNLKRLKPLEKIH